MKNVISKTIYINELNLCTLENCNCGGNINIGFSKKEDLREIVDLLKENGFTIIDNFSKFLKRNDTGISTTPAMDRNKTK